MRTRRIARFVIIALVALLVVATLGFLVWTRLARYPAFPETVAVAEPAKTAQGWYVFQPAQPTDTGFIFYPGGLVDPAAYAPLMQQLSEQGIMSVIVPMPLDLAVFGVDKAKDVIAAYPKIKHWIIGGHSLGGAMATEFVQRNPTAVEGIVLLGSYPSKDATQQPVHVVTIHGSLDGLASPAKIASSLQLLPSGTRDVVIEGGNHAQYGAYGPQAGDGAATISREEQQQQTVEAVVELVNELK